MDDTLQLLAKEVRGKTLRLIDGVGDDEARFAAPGLSNSILWHAGHVLTVVEHLGVIPATGGKPPGYPQGYFETFSWKSKPGPDTRWPSLSEVRDQLRTQLDRLTAAIGAVPADRWGQIVNPDRGWTLRYAVLHGLHDEANHQGEIWLLRKLYGRQTAAATSTGS